MAWLKRINTARDEVAAILEELAMEADKNARELKLPITQDQVKFRQDLGTAIHLLSILHTKATKIELEMRNVSPPAKAYSRPKSKGR